MPFVTDIAGPQRPVQTWPPLATGALRRTSTHRHPSGRDPATPMSTCGPATWWAAERGTGDVLGGVGVRAHLAERVIDDIAADPHDGAADATARQPGRARAFARRWASCFPTRSRGPVC